MTKSILYNDSTTFNMRFCGGEKNNSINFFSIFLKANCHSKFDHNIKTIKIIKTVFCTQKNTLRDPVHIPISWVFLNYHYFLSRGFSFLITIKQYQLLSNIKPPCKAAQVINKSNDSGRRFIGSLIMSSIG